MKASDTELVHKTVAELFDMVKEMQEKIDNALAEISRAINCCESIETECVLIEIKELFKMNTTENYAKQIKNAKRHIEKREKAADAKHIKARLRKARKELNAMECDLEELPLYRAGFQDALNEAINKIDEVLK